MYTRSESEKTILIVLLVSLLILWSRSSFITKVNGEKICDSIEVINNDVELLNQLKDCEVIHGSITLAKISLQNITEYRFSIREITGYLLIYRIEYLTSLENLLPNLTLIRGEENFLQYSLIIYENINLLNLGLKNLLHISDGSIRITRNHQLCYVQTVNWIEILSNISQQNFVMKENRGINHCAVCRQLNSNEIMEVYNENFCWKYDVFQKICKNNGGKRKQNLQKCCTDNCLSSCTLDYGQNSTFCSVCVKFKNPEGKCISNCGSTLYELNNRQCITADHCKSLQLIPFKGKCIKTCPIEYVRSNTDLNCVKCLTSTCPKECQGNLIIYTEADAKMLKGCTKINGYLEIELKPKNTKIIALLESHLSDIEEITGYLKISKSPQIKTLKFLRNLVTVDGEVLFEDKYSLYIYDNFNLETLWDANQKIVFLNGTGFIHLNPKFCIKFISNLNFKNTIDINLIEGAFNISNGYDTYCNLMSFHTTVEEVSSTAARIKINPFMNIENKYSFLGYIYYYIEAPERNLSMFDSFHGCGHDNWQMNISLGINVRHVIRNLKPNTQYAYFVRTFTIMDYHIKLNALSYINYFITKTIGDRPRPITKLFFNVVNSTAIELFWWPPTVYSNENLSYANETSRSYYIALNYTLFVKNSNKNQTKIIINSSCLSDNQYKWRGLNPKESDYYKREQFLVEDLLPNYLFGSSSTKNDAPQVFPSEEKYDENRLKNFLAFINATEMKFQREQDTGIENFKLPEENPNLIILSDGDCCTKTCICLNGIRTNYLIRHLYPSTTYKITVKVCNKLHICSIATYLKVTTMNKLDVV